MERVGQDLSWRIGVHVLRSPGQVLAYERDVHGPVIPVSRID
jgi:hypothetical protein